MLNANRIAEVLERMTFDGSQFGLGKSVAVRVEALGNDRYAIHYDNGGEPAIRKITFEGDEIETLEFP